MRKKAISMILAAALGSALLAGCSSAPKETTAELTTVQQERLLVSRFWQLWKLRELKKARSVSFL